MKTDAEIARDALGILDRDGWCKGMLSTDFSWSDLEGPCTGRHCIGGAVNLAMFGNCVWYGSFVNMQVDSESSPGGEFYVRLMEKIRAMYPDYPFDIRSTVTWQIASWNNDVRTTEADVRAVLEKIAAG